MRGGGDGVASADGLGSGYGRPPSGLVEGGCKDSANLSCARVSECDGNAGGCDARNVGGDGGCFGDDGGFDVGAVNGSQEPDKPAMQPKKSGGAEGVTVMLGDGELLSLTTVLSLNASCLMEASGRRFKEFAILVKGLKERPDIIVVTELGGYSGVVSIQSKM